MENSNDYEDGYSDGKADGRREAEKTNARLIEKIEESAVKNMSRKFKHIFLKRFYWRLEGGE